MLRRALSHRRSAGTLVTTTATVLVALVAIATRPAVAQEEESGHPEIPNDELRAYAEMYLDIAEIQKEMEENVQAASSEAEKERVRAEANREIVAIIEENEEISLERYKQITTTINEDEAQRKEFQFVLAAIRQKREKETEGDDPPGV